ncbi:MAG: hypothetical protein IMX03_05710 [Brockia lithotrophica]|nr:hypothetical protein [Brockia lithotrophica]
MRNILDATPKTLREEVHGQVWTILVTKDRGTARHLTSSPEATVESIQDEGTESNGDPGSRL